MHKSLMGMYVVTHIVNFPIDHKKKVFGWLCLSVGIYSTFRFIQMFIISRTNIYLRAKSGIVHQNREV